MNFEIAEFALQSDRDIRAAVQRARLLGVLSGLPERQRAAFGKAVRKVVEHAIHGGGKIVFGVTTREGVSSVTAVICIREPDSDRASRSELVQKPLPGLDTDWRREVESLVSRVEYRGELPAEVEVRLEQALPAGAAPLVESELPEWRAALETGSAQYALETGQRRIRLLTENLLATQRRDADLERELQELRTLNETLELLALVASKTDNGVVILDAQGYVEWINDSFSRMTGFRPAAIRGQSLAAMLFDEDAEADARRQFQRFLEAGHGLSQEIEQTRDDGQSYWLSIGVTPVFSEEGDITRWVGIANDVTKRREAQRALEQAKEAAEAASRAKGEFLANVSHEIRTPMNVIIGMTELTLGTRLTPEQREYLAAVKNSAEALLRLLNDVLDLSKIEAGKLHIETVPFSLPELIQEVLKLWEPGARQKGLHTSSQVSSELSPIVVGDPVRLRQILFNLIDNAIKFTEQGQVTVTAALDSRTGDEVRVHFAVRDTGIGIPEDKRASIFEAFSQADSSTSRRYGGTGLGLTISAQLVALLNGRLWVESEVGAGSAFHFCLPLMIPGRPPVDEDKPSRRRTPLRAKNRLRVLVADDNPANRLLAARILEKRGHLVLQAGDGREALTAAEREPLDIVVMDAQMPEMDGLQATRQIRAREKTTQTHLPIIALTASAMSGDRERCLAAGMDGYISKPINAQELLTLVETLGTQLRSAKVSDQRGPDGGAAFDFRAALARLEGDVEIFKEQVVFFLRDAPALLVDIQDALAAGDAGRLRTAAHRLKGLAASFDAQAVTEGAFDLEQRGQREDWQGAGAVRQALEEALGQLTTALTGYLELLPSASDSGS
jgi:PAS domain S-box-containing protein